MSRPETIRWRQVVQQYPCPACHVAPGQMCVTTSGHPHYEPHADRARLAAAHHWESVDHDGTESPEDG